MKYRVQIKYIRNDREKTAVAYVEVEPGISSDELTNKALAKLATPAIRRWEIIEVDARIVR